MVISLKKIVIVGAGITGLSAGINGLLKGYKVVIYEKNNFVGGCATGWNKEGYYIDNCMHWLTGTNQFTKNFKLWKKIGAIDETSNLHQCDYFYKSIHNDESISLYTNTEKLRLDMLSLSKEDSKEINKFIDAVNCMIKINQKQNFFVDVTNKAFCYPKILMKYHNLSLLDLSNKFKHPLLKKMFTDYLPKEYSSLALIFAYATFASGNGKIYKAGTKEFINNIFNKYLSLGGEIHFKSEVTNINIINKKINSIVINKKDMITSDYIIYTGDPNYLFKNLIDNSYMPNKLKKKFTNKERYPIHSSFHVAFLVEKNIDCIKDTVIFDIPSTTIGTSKINRLMMKDYSYLYENKPKTVYQAFIVQNMNDYTYWESLKKNNSEEYKKVKNDIANELKNHLINKYPKLDGKISIVDVWTPLTYNEYYHSYYGSYMGFSITNKANYFNITNKIKGIKNFYLTTCWQKICGGLPVGLKQGIDIVNHIKHGI